MREKTLKKTLSIDKDFNLLVLTHEIAHMVYRSRQRELIQYGISAIESFTMQAILFLGGKATPAEISRNLLREHNTVSALLNRMERKGLIKKSRNPDKKNVWIVVLTKKGQDIYVQSAKSASIKTVMSVLSEDERQQFRSCLWKIWDEAIKQESRETKMLFTWSQYTQNQLVMDGQKPRVVDN